MERGDLDEKTKQRIARLPVHDGIPVAWAAVEVAPGVYDNRLTNRDGLERAIRHRFCWICGEPLARNITFPIEPSALVGFRTNIPPCHGGCARYCAEQKFCGFDVLFPGGIVGLLNTRMKLYARDSADGYFHLAIPFQVTWLYHGAPADYETVYHALSDPINAFLERPEFTGMTDEQSQAARAYLLSAATQFLPI